MNGMKIIKRSIFDCQAGMKWGILVEGGGRLNRSIRILVAEEDPGFLKWWKSPSRSRRIHQVEKVSTGDECLEKLQREKFDILLLDHLLSDGKGLDWLAGSAIWASIFPRSL